MSRSIGAGLDRSCEYVTIVGVRQGENTDQVIEISNSASRAYRSIWARVCSSRARVKSGRFQNRPDPFFVHRF